MNTIVKKLKGQKEDDEIIIEAAKLIRTGGIVAFPTETVYGLGANALDSEAVLKIFTAKGRPQDNPLIIHVADFDIDRFVINIPSIAKKFMDKFWPGPLTIIFNKSEIIPDRTSAGLKTVGIRMPENETARKLIEYSMVPIAAPSANISGKPSPTDVERCIEDLYGKVDYILGDKPSKVGVESTIVDCTVTPPCVLRPGGITLEMLREIDPSVYIDPLVMEKPKGDLKPKAPGMKYRHYAPKAPLTIFDGPIDKVVEEINSRSNISNLKGLKVGILSTEETINKYSIGEVLSLGSRENLKEIAKNLFETLRKFDDMGVDVIYSEAFTLDDMGTAIMNRLQKSAGFNIVRLI